jgi:DNA-binding MarR family transcriptional regulator
METSRDIITSVVTLARMIRTEADKRARTHGMTRAQWQILMQLSRQPGMLQKELAEILEVEPITVARLVDRLEARRMVERRGDPSDRRCWRLHLTSESRPLISEINTQLDDLAVTVCRGIDRPERETICKYLHQMRDTVGTELRNAPAEPLQKIA